MTADPLPSKKPPHGTAAEAVSDCHNLESRRTTGAFDDGYRKGSEQNVVVRSRLQVSGHARRERLEALQARGHEPRSERLPDRDLRSLVVNKVIFTAFKRSKIDISEPRTGCRMLHLVDPRRERHTAGQTCQKRIVGVVLCAIALLIEQALLGDRPLSSVGEAWGVVTRYIEQQPHHWRVKVAIDDEDAAWPGADNASLQQALVGRRVNEEHKRLKDVLERALGTSDVVGRLVPRVVLVDVLRPRQEEKANDAQLIGPCRRCVLRLRSRSIQRVAWLNTELVS